MKQRILSLLLCCVLLLGIVSTAVYAEAAPAGSPLTQELIESKKGYSKDEGIQLSAGEYYLTENVCLVGDDAGAWPLALFDGAVTLDLNGYVLDLRGANILAYGNLTLKDSSTGNQSHKFRVEESGLWVWDETNGTETVTGGVITGGVGITIDGGSFGGGVYVSAGKNLTMTNGSIVGCTAGFGGGVYMMGGDNSTFTMEGGHIVGCTAGKNGGGVDVDNKSGYLSTTKFTMAGGSIEDCTAANGGGVYTQSNTEFTMEDGSIQNCTAIETGGGVYGSNTFTMKGGSIRNCAATNGGGVYVGAADTSTMSGGSIEDCTAANGGGVYVGDTGFTMTSGSIQNCTATQAGGGVFVAKDQKSCFTMNGGSISNCKIGEMPNAVHADGTFDNNTKIDKSLLTGINGGQTGQANDPILIGSAEGLKDFRDKVNSGNADLCARLLCDIVLNGGTFDEEGRYKNEKGYAIANTWTPIGTDGNPYSGTFDGKGHTIRGLYVKDQQYAGLFGYVKTDSYGSLTFAVKNLTVTGYIGVSSDSAQNVYAGGIIGCAAISPYGGGAESGTISNCVNRVVINAGSTGEGFSDVHAGGIVGGVEMSNYSGGTATMEIINCANYAAITARSENGSAYVGGIAGQINGSNSTQKINSCFNAGEIRASYGKWSACAGGIIGDAFNGMTAESSVIANCLNVGKVTAEKGSTNAGGIAGKAYTVPISNCCNAGKVDGISRGGIAGDVSGNATVSNCYYLEGTAGWGYNATQEGLKTRAEFADGTVLALLQNGDKNSPWTKTGYLEVAKLRLPLLSWQTADAHEHDYEWQSENGQYWQVCKLCGLETAKQAIPAVVINGAEKVCRTQDYSFSFTLPEGATDAGAGYGFTLLGSDVPLTEKDGVYSGTVKAEWYDAEENAFVLTVNVQIADGFVFSVEKTVTIQNEHTGGEATCTEKAVCDVCGESYGELNANNHADLRHVEAKAATKTAEGNIEHWYCEGCGKYYKDAEATQEIAKEATVTAKLTDGKTPQTGDGFNLTVWLALLLASAAGILALTCGKKKHREN